MALAAGDNLLKNPGFEDTAADGDTPPHWVTSAESAGKVVLLQNDVHGGAWALSIPPNTSIEQTVDSVPAGPFLARCWVKSDAEQSITFLIRNPDAPWAGYTCAELKVPRDQWTQLEAFCDLEQAGPMSFSLGGVSKEFHLYHGTEQDTAAPVIVDDFELVPYQPKPLDQRTAVAVWDHANVSNSGIDWDSRAQWTRVADVGHNFAGTAVFKAGPLLGTVSKDIGSIAVCSIQQGSPKQRCVLLPSPHLENAKCALVLESGRSGIRVSAAAGGASYTVWLSDRGVLQVEAKGLSHFRIADCRMRYGILPSFVGSDICYTPATMPNSKEFNIPSTQWFVGLVDGSESMLVAAWETNAQPVALGLSGAAEKRVIDSVSIGADPGRLAISFVEHTKVWHRQTLNEDWLGEYIPVGWQRPFEARWMCHFYVSPGGRPSFREPDMNYSFPIASAKTRMWGVWFEDWNHYPFFFDGQQTVFHFEKTFVPQGDALIYFLEPAAADLISPCEVVQQLLGPDKAAALFDFEANQLRKLSYSTPDKFMFDRPVCATTTRLSKIRAEEKSTLGVDLATHLYEFIREIRARVDQYGSFFEQMKIYFADNRKARPEMAGYLFELEAQVSEAQARSKEIYGTSLESVQKKIAAMKAQLQEGRGDGYNCGNLDVRGAAGAQDDLCRRYNRCVLKLMQTAAFKCGDSPEKAKIAEHVWEESRKVLRRPTRWEARRTLYFFEP